MVANPLKLQSKIHEPGAVTKQKYNIRGRGQFIFRLMVVLPRRQEDDMIEKNNSELRACSMTTPGRTSRRWYQCHVSAFVAVFSQEREPES